MKRVCEHRPVVVKVNTCRHEWREEKACVTVCRCVPEARTETYTVMCKRMVPYAATRTVCVCVPHTETVTATRMVCRTVEKQVPVAPCAEECCATPCCSSGGHKGRGWLSGLGHRGHGCCD
jgi:hypothetical protein